MGLFPNKQIKCLVPADDISQSIRRNPIAAGQAALERIAIGMKRMLNGLGRQEVAGIRTLEMQISDGGPIQTDPVVRCEDGLAYPGVYRTPALPMARCSWS